MENKSASLLVVSWGKALKGIPPASCGRQVVRPSSLPVVVASVYLDFLISWINELETLWRRHLQFESSAKKNAYFALKTLCSLQVVMCESCNYAKMNVQ